MRVFLDMDGVPADYYAGICRAFAPDVPAWPYRCRPGDWNFFTGDPLNLTNELVAPVMGHGFYQGLDLLPDARAIVAHAESLAGDPERVYFLSSPWDTPGCDEGKREWVRKHFPGYFRRTLIGSCKEACAYTGAVLFDDSPANCEKFVAAGGYACLVPRPWNDRHAECDHATGAVLNLSESLRTFYWR